ncbi:hypothetical protein [Rubidibacter lacunae]|uniref:hypothetical protein n=1 Tax=Rubidibacter lacunae TaxID=582514 RepID=UPI0008FEDB26
MVRAGMAWHYDRYSGNYPSHILIVEPEAEARSLLGIKDLRSPQQHPFSRHSSIKGALFSDTPIKAKRPFEKSSSDVRKLTRSTLLILKRQHRVSYAQRLHQQSLSRPVRAHRAVAPCCQIRRSPPQHLT